MVTTEMDQTNESSPTEPVRKLPFRRASPPAPAATSAPRFVVRVSRSDTGQLLIEADGPPGRAEAHVDLAIKADDDRLIDSDFQSRRRVGVLLYNTLFPPHILRLLEESRLAAGEADLPIDLAIDDDELVVLPWELLRDPETDRFIALSGSIQLSRIQPENGTPSPLLPVPPIGALKVAIVAQDLGEPEIGLAQAVGTDKRVEVSLSPAGATISASPHVVQLTGVQAHTSLPASVRLLIVDGDARSAQAALLNAPAAIALPASMTFEERTSFLASLYSALASGAPPDAGVTSARRAVARAHSASELDWALPVLITRGIPQPVVMPPRAVAGTVGRRAKDETVGWAKSTLSGAVSSVVLFLVGLTLFRLGFSGSPDLSFSVISPFSLYASLKTLVLELSTFGEYVLLVTALAFAVLTASALVLWRRKRALMLPAGQHDRWLFDLLTPISGLRSVSFFGMATLTILGAFVYQQYLWNVLLPIDDDALGIAITRDTAAATFGDDLADSLYAEGQTRDIVIRELPVKFNARDTDRARALGKRIGADAVMIYRSEKDATTGADQYVAYVVFTDPTVSFASPSETNVVPTEPEEGQAVAIDVRTGAAIPVLRTDQMTELVDAAAGIIAYQEDRYRDAIEHLSRIPLDGSANTGIVAYYLGRALDLDNQDVAAIQAYETAINYYESREDETGSLGPQEIITLVDTFIQRGRIDRYQDKYDAALAWYLKGVDYREAALARANDLDRPTDVPATFAHLYAELADIYRIKGDTEQQRFWNQRASEEADAIAAAADDDDTVAMNQEMTARFFAGDCVDALAVAQRVIDNDPDSADAYIGASAIALFQGRPDLAEGYVRELLEHHPEDVRGRSQLAALLWQRVIGSNYFDPAAIADAEVLYRETLAIDPTNFEALNLLAEAAKWRGDGESIDLYALLAGDDLTVAKSQATWGTDPQRIEAARQSYSETIDVRLTIATELDPGNIEQELNLAQAYLDRQNLLTDWVNASFGQELDDARQSAGEQVVADSIEIRRWTTQALAGEPNVSDYQHMRAWQIMLDSLNNEWSWHFFFSGDMQRADALQAEYQAGVATAVELVESTPPTTADEYNAATTIYFSAALGALMYESDQELATQYQTTALEFSQREIELRSASTKTIDTICTEEREREAGVAAQDANNLDAAEAHFAAAMQINPTHTPTLLNAAALAAMQGDHTRAANFAEQATVQDPTNAVAWEQLAVSATADNNATQASAAWDRFFEISAGSSTMRQIYLLTLATNDVYAMINANPALSASVTPLLTRLSNAAALLDADASRSYQLPALYAAVGRLALWCDMADEADSALVKSLQLDPHQPDAVALQLLTTLSLDQDAEAATDRAIFETRDPLWESTYLYTPAMLLDLEEAQIDAFVSRFPERAESVEDFRTRIAEEREQIAADTATP